MNYFDIFFAFFTVAVILLMVPFVYLCLGSRNYLKFHISWRLKRFFDKLQWTFIELAPRWVICLAFARMLSETTTGKHSRTNVAEVRAVTCAKRWSRADA